MKKIPLAILIIFSSPFSFAQSPPDSAVMVQQAQLYTINKPEDLNIKGQIDAARHYKRYKGAATGTLITSLLSPVIGRLPKSRIWVILMKNGLSSPCTIRHTTKRRRK